MITFHFVTSSKWSDPQFNNWGRDPFPYFDIWFVHSFTTKAETTQPYIDLLMWLTLCIYVIYAKLCPWLKNWGKRQAPEFVGSQQEEQTTKKKKKNGSKMVKYENFPKSIVSSNFGEIWTFKKKRFLFLILYINLSQMCTLLHLFLPENHPFFKK